MRQRIVDENAPMTAFGCPSYELRLLDGGAAPIELNCEDRGVLSSVGARLLAAALLAFADEVDRRLR